MFDRYVARVSAFADLAHVALRVMLGIVLTYHGWGKVTHGYAVNFFRHVGIPLPEILGPFISFVELFGGVGLVLGLFTRYLGALFTIEFLVVLWVLWGVQSRPVFGAELELLILTISAMLATNGGGSISLGRMLGRFDP